MVKSLHKADRGEPIPISIPKGWQTIARRFITGFRAAILPSPVKDESTRTNRCGSLVPSPHEERMGRGLGRGVILTSFVCLEAAPLPARSSQGEGENSHSVRVSSCVRAFLSSLAGLGVNGIRTTSDKSLGYFLSPYGLRVAIRPASCLFNFKFLTP
jgi:hypothetical protein